MVKKKAHGAADSLSFDPLEKQQPSSAHKLYSNKVVLYIIKYNIIIEALTALFQQDLAEVHRFFMLVAVSHLDHVKYK